ncbi:MAG TPA: lasso peptide biosynthesis B2 protein [Thermoanaerobaculia bacterium]|nr:lasso peptide biosynthesis B2 protein [Thermoanaerobaculia bacterium]
MDGRFEAAEHVRSSTGEEGTVLLDLRSGKYFALNAVGGLLWESMAAGASRSVLVQRLAERFPEVPADRLGHDADALLSQLLAKGLLRPRTGPGDEKEAPAPRPVFQPVWKDGSALEAATASPFWVPIAFLALLASDFILQVLGFSRFHGLVRRIPTRPAAASAARAQRIVRSVDRASAFYFKRAWCLQRSAVTAGLLRLSGLPARLVIGARRVPFYAHAWVELDGRVVNDRPAVRQEYEVLETC